MYFGMRLFMLVLMCQMGWMGSMHRWWAGTLPCNVTELLPGIEVDCSGQRLTVMPKDIPRNTTQLSLLFDKIFVLSPCRSINQADFQDLGGLLELDLSQNCPQKSHCNTSIDIGSKAFEALSKLKKLYLNDNHLQSIPQDLPLKLEELYLKSNEIAHLNKSILKSAIRLHVLHLDFNCYLLNECLNFTVEHDAFGNFKHLLSLSLSSNNMSTIPQNLPHTLRFLNLSNCNLKMVAMRIANDTFSEMPKLKNLVLRSMSLRHISQDMFRNNTQLMHLDLSLNYIAKPIAEGSFLVHLSNLTSLDLSFNYEPSHYFKQLNLSDHFSALTSLNKLFIRGYIFEKLEVKQLGPLKNLQNLQYIEMSINFIKKTRHSDLEWEIYGKSLDLSLNNIFFVTPELFKGMTDIKCLNLSTNAMGQTFNGSQFTTLTQLKYLDLSFNRLDLFFPYALTELEALTVLDLSFNAHYFAMEGIIHNINFISNMHSLQVLNLSNNGIQSLSRSTLKLPHLQILDLSDNNLVTLSPNVKNIAIQHLDLSHNDITSLPDWFLQNVPNLKVLDVSFNKLTASNTTGFPTSELERLDKLGLRGNRFVCTCDNGWFSTWLNHSSVIIPLLAVDVLCDTPDSHRGCPVVKALDAKACSLVTLGRGLSLFFATTIIIMIFGVLAGNRWHWELAYGLEVLRARWRGGYWDAKAMADDYDAFVDYDVNSVEVSEWVLHELRVQLEEGTGRPLHLCLEERDWVPGISVVDNLSESILQSRKTIFVLTRDFAASGRFQQALGMAQQRLLDEGTDVILFVLLEEPRRPSRYLQLRQRVVPGSDDSLELGWDSNPG
uniref:Toll like receptor 7 n=1 Tax=Eptatretus burgeri TaxID=7764 RepID=A0A8C4N9G3_EPTBU